jgi:hypothetical protein
MQPSVDDERMLADCIRDMERDLVSGNRGDHAESHERLVQEWEARRPELARRYGPEVADILVGLPRAARLACEAGHHGLSALLSLVAHLAGHSADSQDYMLAAIINLRDVNRITTLAAGTKAAPRPEPASRPEPRPKRRYKKVVTVRGGKT